MDKLTSILVVAGRSDADRMLLDKAILLARSVGARIYLFSCDPILAKLIQHNYSNEDAEKSRASISMSTWPTCADWSRCRRYRYPDKRRCRVCQPPI